MASRTVQSRGSSEGLGLPVKATHQIHMSNISQSHASNSHSHSHNNSHNHNHNNHTKRTSSSNSSSNSNINMTPAVYLQRLLDVSQMDIQSALDQMKSLLLPSKMNSVYKMAYYRKQTKDHWARDDPAFVAIQIAMLVVASLAYAIAFRSDSLLTNYIYFLIHSVGVNYALFGVIVASVGRFIANSHLNHSNPSAHVSASASASANGNASGSAGMPEKRSYYAQQSVEFMYAFDVHCNAFFFLFTCAYGVQFFLLPVVLGKGFVSFLLSNMLYSIGFFGYFYITHLGYRGEYSTSDCYSTVRINIIRL